MGSFCLTCATRGTCVAICPALGRYLSREFRQHRSVAYPESARDAKRRETPRIVNFTDAGISSASI